MCKYNNCNSKTPLARYKIGHGFMYDDCLWRSTKKPISFLKKMGKFAAWSTPDFSIDINASVAQTIGIIENSRFIGRLGQEYGQSVFATVGWSRAELDDICFAGLRDGACFFISTLGVKNKECEKGFLRGYVEMKKTLSEIKDCLLGIND